MSEINSLEQRLGDLLSPASEESQASPPSAPWYVHILLAFSGWFAALFLLGFFAFGLNFIIDDRAASALVGMLMLAGVYWLLNSQDSEFTHHIGLAFSVAGQGLLLYGFSAIYDVNHSVFWLCVSAFELLLMWFMPSFLHRLFSACLVGLSFAACLNELHWIALANPILLATCVFVWLQEFSNPSRIRKIQGIGYGFVLAVILGKTASLAASQDDSLAWVHATSGILFWLDEGLTVAVFLALVTQSLRRYGQSLSSPTAVQLLLFSTVLCVGSFFAQGVTTGMVILILGFSVSNRKLMILGGASLLYYVSNYYYNLDTPLLHKAYSFAFLGVILLTMRFAWNRMTSASVGEQG